VRLLRKKALGACERGATAVEFAIAFPAFVTLLFGVYQIGMALYVNTALRGAVADGARFASTFPQPSDTEIEALIKSTGWGIDPVKITALTFTRGEQNDVPYVEINLKYDQQIDIAFWKATTVKFNHQQRAYMYR
jgi:Flp pilus assembly protein TadG